MSSMRKLRRRLLRWERYEARAARLVPQLRDRGRRPGHLRTAWALAYHRDRLLWGYYPLSETYPGSGIYE